MAIKFVSWQSVEHFDVETERLIVKRLKAGDTDALSEIYHKYKNPLMGCINRIIKDPVESEDLTQEVFFRFHKHIKSFKGKSRIGTYLYSIAKNLALDHLRHIRTLKRKKLDLKGTPDGEADVFLSPEVSPEEHVLNTEILSAIYKALGKFPTRTARVLEMWFLEQRSHKEISEELGITVARSRSLLSENRGRLQEALQPLWGEYS